MNNYFNDYHEGIVEKYKTTDSLVERNKYITELYPTFQHMAVTLLRMYANPKCLPNMDDYVSIIITKMISALDTYNKSYSDKPTSAHRYLTTVAINHIRFEMKKHNRQIDKPVVGEKDEDLYMFEIAAANQYHTDNSENQNNWLSDYFKWFTKHFKAKIPLLYESDLEQKIAMEFVAIFENIRNIDTDNIWKKPIYSHIRHKLNISKGSVHITQVRKLMFDEYKKGIVIWKKNYLK